MSVSQPRMAVVAVCYDRWDNLERALPTWRTLAGAPPIFVGTYAEESVPDWAGDAWIVSARHDPFHLSRLRNAVALEARRRVDPEYLLFTDADILVREPDVFSRCLARTDPPPDVLLDSPFALDGEYVALHADDPERGDEGKRGTFVVRTELFVEIAGYDQRLIGWGLEDLNLYERLRDAGATIGHFDRDGIEHLTHSDEVRFRHNPEDARSHLPAFLHNLRVHMGSYDAEGAAWRDALGYPDVDVYEPGGPGRRPV